LNINGRFNIMKIIKNYFGTSSFVGYFVPTLSKQLCTFSFEYFKKYCKCTTTH
jgi:hypothetical protein